MTAERAYAIGLVDESATLDSALKPAASIAGNGPLAVAVAERLARQSADWSFSECGTKQGPTIRMIVESEDAKEGSFAFVEKRPPAGNWSKHLLISGKKVSRYVDFTGRCVIVTGSTKGIGAAIARKVVDAGGAVVINSSSSVDAGHRLASELGEAVYVQGDVGADGVAEKLVAAATNRWGRVDGVVNNVAVTVPVRLDDFESLTAAHWRKVLDANLVAPFMLTRAALPQLKSNHGWVVNISSIAGRRQIGSSLPYAVSKAALDQLTRTMARFLGPDVRVNGLAPGAVNSDWSDGLDDRKAAIRAKTPLARAAEPSEIAEACLGLAASRFVTGHVLIVDGGLSLVV